MNINVIGVLSALISGSCSYLENTTGTEAFKPHRQRQKEAMLNKDISPEERQNAFEGTVMFQTEYQEVFSHCVSPLCTSHNKIRRCCLLENTTGTEAFKPHRLRQKEVMLNKDIRPEERQGAFEGAELSQTEYQEAMKGESNASKKDVEPNIKNNTKSSKSSKHGKRDCIGDPSPCIQSTCTISSSVCVQGRLSCIETPKMCEEGFSCDMSDGECKPNFPEERDIFLNFSSWDVQSLFLEGINESQVVWDVAFASKKTLIHGKCIAKQRNLLEEMALNDTASELEHEVTSNLVYFLETCSLGSVDLHVTLPRTAKSICFNEKENCRPVMCSLGGDLPKMRFDGDLSQLSYAPGNNQIFFGLNKNCEIVEPYHWKEFIDTVIGDVGAKWSDNELYRMDFDGDGLTNIIEYYGLRLGDMYVDIAHGGHPPVEKRDWPFQFPSSATDPYNVDTDGDLLTDSFELLFGMDPREFNDINADSDGDGLTDFQEQIFGTSPYRFDTDGDSVNDSDEVEFGTSPLDDSDFNVNVNVSLSHGNLLRNLQLSQTIPITLRVGDHSDSNSERWVIRVGSIEHAATEFGVVSQGIYKYRAGVYPVTVRHIDSNLNSPDYDYTARITWPKTPEFSHFDVKLDDPDKLLGIVVYSSEVDRTLGKIAYLHISSQGDCTYNTCVECNTDSTCQWNGDRKSCEVYDPFVSIPGLKDTPDDCVCGKCSDWAQEERSKGFGWINNLPRCPCHVEKDVVSSSATSINVLDFEGGVTRSSTSLDPGETDVTWYEDMNCNPNNAAGCSKYHPGAYGCLRALAFMGPHGQQCCYDSSGDYIPAGTKAAGTPDFEASTWTNGLWLPHIIADVDPYDYCCNDCETPSTCNLYIGNDPNLPGVRADLRGCELLTPAHCGDGTCERDKGETCPTDCDPLKTECGDGICDHGETFYNCSSDCPSLPSSSPQLPSDPIIMPSDFIELISRCANLSSIVYTKDEALQTKTVQDYYEYIDWGSIADAALISREYDKGRCIIALRGTDPSNIADLLQVINPAYRWVDGGKGQGCNVREGWAQAFFGTTLSGEVIENHYGERLGQRIQHCITDNLKLVFTGHSQGGALALVGHLAYNEHNPISITFAAPPTFVNEVYGDEGDPCPIIRDNQTYRFINTEHDELALNYDLVPFVGDALADIITAIPLLVQTNVLVKLFGEAVAALTAEALKHLIGIHKGPVAFLPPEADKNIKVYRNHSEVIKPLLWMFDVLDIGLNDGFLSAHSIATYADKVQLLLKEPPTTKGFKAGMQCNYNEECSSEKCEAPKEKTCLRLLSNGKYDCDDHEDCESKRCNLNLIGYETCEPKLEVGSDCYRDPDCKSSYCHFGKCHAKLENGDVTCLDDEYCESGYCNRFGCGPLITDDETWCYDHDACWTGRCRLLYCRYKLFEGEECDDDVDCMDGTFCNTDTDKCQRKLELGKKCENHYDCVSGRCGYPARKVCL